MSEQAEQQAEEREALESIYEGDNAFKQINETTFQYKYGEDNDLKSFLVEIKWGENYPSDLPQINMNTFYNQNLLNVVKEKIQNVLLEEAQQWVGCGMTYTLFECLKDRLEELTAEQTEHVPVQTLESDVAAIKISDNSESAKKKEPKKEQLSKSQKRRQWERTDHKGDRPRGWNWVDVIKHLSQTGQKEQRETDSTANVNISSAVLQPLNS